MEKLNRTLRMALIGLAMAGMAAAAAAVERWVPLAGEWRFALDPKDEGIAARWFGEELRDFIRLPGTTDDNRRGTLNEAVETQRLTRIYPYVGAAWYQRDIDVPRAWAGKRIVLLLERTKSSRLWVDGNPVGAQDSLVAPHLYPLGALALGQHRLTLRIDNAALPPIGDAHQISDQTQTNWNGVIGKLGLVVTDPVWIDDIQVYPDRGARKIRVQVEVGNISGQPAVGTLTLNVASGRRASPPSAPLRVRFSSAGRAVAVKADYALEEGALEWDEFSPTVYRLAVSLESSSAGQTFRDQQEITFGLREFTALGTQFHINGKTIFLRGKVDNCVFPLTGYPPMTVDGWVRVFRTAKSFGINHYRFHTWCPPEAAFEAADQLGIYLQPELPNWSAFGQPEHDDFLRAEGERILRAFGNHPSFVMLSLGNELGGRQELMAPFVKHFRELDGRHLYAQGSNNWFPNVAAGDDYWVTFQVGGRKVRGSYATVDAPLGHVQTGPPSTLKDYSAEIAGVPVPVVSHEIGEYQVGTDFREIGKYVGVLRPRNLEAFRNRLEDRGLLNQAGDFMQASGALSALCYREDIEAALRTRGFGGFQLLDLQDFPGQGTALVGILDAFLESKGLAEPVRWREFCSETVPLVRLEKFTWTNSETLTAAAEVAHYGPTALTGAAPAWALRDSRGRILASERLPGLDIPQGTLTSLGQIRVSLARVAAPAKLRLELELRGTRFRNVYDVWVYPDTVDTAPRNVVVSRVLDQSTRQALRSGGRVLLMPEPARLTNGVGGMFASDFWNYGMFRKFAEERHSPVAPGTLGILCDSRHPALSRFPTEFYSNWQWFHLIQNSRAVILDGMPAGYRPVVQVIDNYERAHRLGVLFEVQVGPGRLLVCTMDLPGQQDKPEARQLLHSLLQYMNSDQFAPLTAVEEAALERILQ